MNKIDFVITWVDSNDPAWQKEFKTYLPQNHCMNDIRTERYRNWDNLRYWFRGVEKFAPWVNKVHFISCGQVPDWLNLNAPKLHFVKHSDYIPAEYLPTFSSRPIILNLHRIKELSEHFVIFDDDCFLIDKVEPKRFFRKGLPCDMAAFNVMSPSIPFTPKDYNNLCVINSSFKNMKCCARISGNGFPLRREINYCAHSFYYRGPTLQVFIAITCRKVISNPL